MNAASRGDGRGTPRGSSASGRGPRQADRQVTEPPRDPNLEAQMAELRQMMFGLGTAVSGIQAKIDPVMEALASNTGPAATGPVRSVPEGISPLAIPTGTKQTTCARGEAARLAHKPSAAGEGTISTLRKKLGVKKGQLKATNDPDRQLVLAQALDRLADRIVDHTDYEGPGLDRTLWANLLPNKEEHPPAESEKDASTTVPKKTPPPS